MPLRRTYDEDGYDPPAPVIPATFSLPSETPRVSGVRVNAQIDSGADCIFLPDSLVERLGLEPVYEVDCAGYDGTVSRRLVYAARVRIEGVAEYILEVVGTPDDTPLLGRDVINRWRLLLDGPGRASEINSVGP